MTDPRLSMSLRARTGDGSETKVEPALVLTLWDGNGLRDALRKFAVHSPTIRPDVIQLHAGPRELLRNAERVWREVRALVGGPVALWLGVGADGTIDDMQAGRASAADVTRPLVDVSRLAQSMGARVFVLDPEGEWKSKAQGGTNGLARDVSIACADAAPGVVQAVTTFDHPSYHAAFPWRGFLGHDSPCSLFLPQVYAGAVVAGSPQLVAPHRRALPRREEASLSSIRAAVRAGWLRPDEKSASGADTSADDIDVVPYVQGHSVDEHATFQLLCESPIACVWAAMTRLDARGLRALRRALKVRRVVVAGPGAVRAFQALRGLTVDGWAGPQTAAAVDAEPEP